MRLVPVPKDQYGQFYEGDSYIVYAALEYGKRIGPGVKVGQYFEYFIIAQWCSFHLLILTLPKI